MSERHRGKRSFPLWNFRRRAHSAKIWSGGPDSNWRPLAPQASALNRTAPPPDYVLTRVFYVCFSDNYLNRSFAYANNLVLPPRILIDDCIHTLRA